MTIKQHQLNEIDSKIDHLIDRIAEAQTLNTNSNGDHFYSDFEKYNYIATLEHRKEVLQAKSAGLQSSFTFDEQVALIKELREEIDLITETAIVNKTNQLVAPYAKLISLFEKHGYVPPSPSSDVFLFLDDVREPEDAFNYTTQEMFITKKWEVVRNFDEFKSHIEDNGLPAFISFDHDLADTHYAPKHLWTDYDKSKEWQEQQVHKEKTGYECALWLVDYCIDNNLKLPEYYCHSMNPVGRDKIIGLLQNCSL